MLTRNLPGFMNGLALTVLTALASSAEPPRLDRWQTFDDSNGLPSRHVFAVLVDGDAVWAGTEKGVAKIEGDKVIAVWDERQGLPYPVVTSLARSSLTGDLWIGTMGGLARLSAGRIDAFTQLSSGLANDVVYGVAADGPLVWAATAAGLSRLDTRTGSWEIFDTTNTLMHEPWTYGVVVDDKAVYIAVWGGGIVVRDRASGRFRDYRDPDGEAEIDLFRDDGPIHDVTSALAVGDGLLWQSTYFGLSRYDGRRWRTWTEKDSGLTSSFVISLRPQGRSLWIGTDNGLSHLDGETWRSWRRRAGGGWEMETVEADGKRSTTEMTAGPAGNTIYLIDLDRDHGVWLATAEGLSHGMAGAATTTGAKRPAPARASARKRGTR